MPPLQLAFLTSVPTSTTTMMPTAGVRRELRRIPLLGTRLNRGHEAGSGARGVRSDRCKDPVGTEGEAPTGSRSKLRLQPLSSRRSSFGRRPLEGQGGLRVGLDHLPVVRLGGLQDTLPRGPLSAEGGHKRAVLAAQDHYVWIRLVQVVAELWKPSLYHPHHAPPPPSGERYHEGREEEISSRCSGRNSRCSPSTQRTSTATYSSPPQRLT